MGTVGCGNMLFEWFEDWGEAARSGSSSGWAHHDVVVSRSGLVIAFHAETDEVIVWDAGGRLVRSWPSGLFEGHGMTLARAGGAERLWIADCGMKMVPDANGRYTKDVRGKHGRVVEFTLEGAEVSELPLPPGRYYQEDRYAPTGVAVVDASAGGSGDIWVADGYGHSLLHAYDHSGTHQLTLDGESGEGRFNCPHGIFIDTRGSEPLLHVADRGNARLQVFDLEGTYVRTVGAGYLKRPSAVASDGERLYVAELDARVTVFDEKDGFVGWLGEDASALQRPGWPNAQADDDNLTRPDGLRPGSFNSPHGLAVGPRGDLFVAEWLIGGRMTRLRPLAA